MDDREDNRESIDNSDDQIPSERDRLMYTLDMLLELEDIVVAMDQQDVAERIGMAAIKTKFALRQLDDDEPKVEYG